MDTATKIFIYCLVLSAALLSTGRAQQATLIRAVENNDFSGAKSLLDKGADPNAYGKDGDNVLITAALFASADCMRLLLEHRADPNLKNKYGEAPLMLCVNDLEKMKLLLEYGARINDSSSTKSTALLIACGAGASYETVRWLIDNGADLTGKRWGAETALMRASQFSDTMVIRLLLSRGLGINDHPSGYTPLMYAARSANWPAIFCLLDNGADADIPDPTNTTVLLWAAEQNNLGAVTALLERTSDVNTVDKIAGMTPLMWAAYNEHDNPEIIKLLLGHGAKVNARAKNGLTALGWALKKGNTGTVAVLRKAGAK